MKMDFSARDAGGKVVFYVLLWKRKGISLELFDDYWRNVHGPVCARLPGQHQYWQLHVAHNDGGVWPQIVGIEYSTKEENQFDGIAELSFQSDEDRVTWFQAAGILMDDEHNLFSKAIGYNTSAGNSITYVDGIPVGDPNGAVGVSKFHVMVKKADGVSVADFRTYLKDEFAKSAKASDSLLKLRLHLFEEVDGTRPDAAGVAHSEPAEENYQAAFEIAFTDRLAMETFFASKEYAAATANQAKFVKQICPFPERTAFTFVYDGAMTLGGQRSSTVAELIHSIGATNQLKSAHCGADVGQPIGRGASEVIPPKVDIDVTLKENAVLGDPDLQAALKGINPAWGDLCVRVAGEVWGLPLIDQKTKALITIAVDVVNTNENGPGSPFGAHVSMALKQGATWPEIEEVLLFMSAYAGFNKVASAFGRLNELKAAQG